MIRAIGNDANALAHEWPLIVTTPIAPSNLPTPLGSSGIFDLRHLAMSMPEAET
jgi:hypothetical protein